MIDNKFITLKIPRPAILLAVALLVAFLAQLPTTEAQTNLTFPNVSQNTSTSVKWTAGTVNNGAHAVSVSASTASVSAYRDACTAPSFTACNIVYANSSGTVSVVATSNAIITANSSGNTILAYVETTAAGAISRIVYPQQASVANLMISMSTECLASTSCAAPVSVSGMRVAAGSATLSGGAVTITGISPAFAAFNTTTLAPSFSCIAVMNASTTTAAAQSIRCVPVSATSLTITVGASASATDVMRWVAISSPTGQ